MITVNEYEEKIKFIMKHYGLENQLGMLQEEASEVIQAINKCRRKDISKTNSLINMYEEIADLKIVLDQIMLETDPILITLFIEEKINRQTERIKEEKR